MSDPVRVGIVGLGMGMSHARDILEGRVSDLRLAAVCDLDPLRLARLPEVAGYLRADEMIGSGNVDAVLVATPHYTHTPIGVEVLNAGLHLLVEKPLGVHKTDCERLIAGYEQRPEPRPVFAAMFNQRTDGFFRKIRELVQGGELGEIRRVNWIVTDWYRTDAYFRSSSWRATWRGEGGGILLNQCMHQIDILQWIFGMPARVRADCRFGKYHPIEVEDEVTAFLEFPNGASGIFVTSTGEYPGSNRLEISGEMGKLVYEDDVIRIARNRVGMTEFSRRASDGFAVPGVEDIVVLKLDHGGQHAEILSNFGSAILRGTPLLAPATDGIRSVELVNAMLMSTWLNDSVTLPLDGDAYRHMLEIRMRGSRELPAAVALEMGTMGT